MTNFEDVQAHQERHGPPLGDPDFDNRETRILCWERLHVEVDRFAEAAGLKTKPLDMREVAESLVRIAWTAMRIAAMIGVSWERVWCETIEQSEAIRSILGRKP